MADFLLYGAYGYTGRLIAEEAVRRGMKPLLAGRNAERLRPLAEALDLPWQAFPLEDNETLTRALRQVPLVVHAAGPFLRTARPMVMACVQTGTHYLDITGEIPVFEALTALDDTARAAGVMLLPGAGFDVAATDTLAVHLKRRLPTATHLDLAFTGVRSGGPSHGTASTMLYNLHRFGGKGLVRREGHLVAVPLGQPSRHVDFGRGPRRVHAIPWGDVSTAYISTGIPNITVYTYLGAAGRWLPLLRPFLSLLRLELVYRLAQRWVDAHVYGPTETARWEGFALIVGEVWDDTGNRAVSRMRTPEGYTFTVLAVLELVSRVLAGEVHPGFQTPGQAYGPDWVLSLPGVMREDL